MSKEKLADRIKQLIYISQFLIISSNKLKELHDNYLPKSALDRQEYKTSDISLLIRLLHSSFYYDALLNLNSILNPLQKDSNKRNNQFFY